MLLKLIRKGFTPTSTEGDLFVDGVLECHTVEDVVRDGPKVYGKTAIPAGRYKVSVTYSPRFKKDLPILHDVPGFTGIRIHSGNTSADSEGCIIVGAKQTKLTDDYVGESRKALAALIVKLKLAQNRGKDIWIDIVEQREKAAA